MVGPTSSGRSGWRWQRGASCARDGNEGQSEGENWELALSVGEVWGERAEQQTRKELWRRACARARRGRKKRKGDDDVCAPEIKSKIQTTNVSFV
jgi:hypothetical protein